VRCSTSRCAVLLALSAIGVQAVELPVPPGAASTSAAASAAAAPAVTAPAEPAASAAETATADVPPASTAAAPTGDFCFFAHTPASDVAYTTLRELRVGKGTYGGVKDLLPKLVAEARAMGGDAIIHYDGAQRFGFWPWRMVRPVVHGVAIKWKVPVAPDCNAVGGTLLSTILATDRPPPRQ